MIAVLATACGPGAGAARSIAAGPAPLVMARAPGCPVRASACENRIEYGSGSERLTGVFGYDASGAITSYCETTPDGTVRFALTRSYDARGRRVRQVEDGTIGAAHVEVAWVYDDADRVVRYTSDMDGVIRVNDRAFDADGRIAREVQTEDGRTTDIETYRYGDGDALVVDELHDTHGDGTIDWGWRYTFAAGRWLARIDDLAADGTSHPSEWFTYDPAVPGRVTRRDLILAGGGTTTDITQIAWRGRDLAQVSYDNNGDGTADQVEDYTLDRAGRLTRQTWSGQSSPSQPFSFVTTASWRGGNPEHIERRDAASGEVIEAWTFDRGCDADRDMTLRLAPVTAWDREVDTQPFTVDVRRFWGFPEVL